MFQGYDPQRIGLHAEWMIKFIKKYNKNQSGAKFRINDAVMYNGNRHTILAVNIHRKDKVGYILSGIYGDLVQEEELYGPLKSKSQLRRLKIQKGGG